MVKAEDVKVAVHPDGYRIDKTASPMNRYTKWTVLQDGKWCEPKPVCFHSLPESGWVEVERFDWESTQRQNEAESS